MHANKDSSLRYDGVLSRCLIQYFIPSCKKPTSNGAKKRSPTLKISSCQIRQYTTICAVHGTLLQHIHLFFVVQMIISPFFCKAQISCHKAICKNLRCTSCLFFTRILATPLIVCPLAYSYLLGSSEAKHLIIA